ncbi:MAG TPA: hypothetical protein VIM65_15360 [Cyclobacteriaceae bacterium]
MTKAEAQVAIEKGRKVTHEYFSNNEWVTVDKTNPSFYLFEDDVRQRAKSFWEMRIDDAWNEGWSIYNENE